MSKSKLVAAALASAIVFSPIQPKAEPVAAVAVLTTAGPLAAVYGVMGCAGTLMLAAAIKGQLLKQQLTPAEAYSCGLTFLLRP